MFNSYDTSSSSVGTSSVTARVNSHQDHYHRARIIYFIHKKIRNGIIKVGGKEFYSIIHGELSFDFDVDVEGQAVPRQIILKASTFYNCYFETLDNSMHELPLYTGNINIIAKINAIRTSLPVCLFEVKVRVLALAMPCPRTPISQNNELNLLVRDLNIHYPVYRISYPYNLMDRLPIIKSGTLVICIGSFVNLHFMRAVRILACLDNDVPSV